MAFERLKKRAVSLDCFIRGIVQALCNGQQAIPQSREDHLMHHMQENADGTLSPKTLTITTDDKSLDVTTYALSQVNAIGIHKATIRCSAKLVDVETSDNDGKISHGDQCCTFHVSPSPEGRKTFEMEIEFIQRQHLEAENRIIDLLNNSVCVEKTND